MIEIEYLKEIFKNTLDTFNFINPYLSIDLEFTERDYNTLSKDKIPNGEIKTRFKTSFKNYKVSFNHGGFYLEKTVGCYIILFFFKVNRNIFQPYFHLYLNSLNDNNLINYERLTSGQVICKYLLNDFEYPIKAKIFANIEELIHITKNEILFFEGFTDVFLQKVAETNK
jgi:hypothetical protein